MNPALATRLENLARSAFASPLKGTAAGVGLSALENATVLGDADPTTKHMNLVLGGVTGLGMGGAGKEHQMARLAGWPLKEVGLMGYDAGKKFVNVQQPIAETNLDAARLNKDTAQLVADKAKHISPQDIGSLITGMAAAGGAAGLGYYLYHKIGPGKKPAAPKVTIQLPKTHGTNGSSIEMEADPVNLSKNLYKSLARDAKRKLRQEARAGVIHEKKKPEEQEQEEPKKEASELKVKKGPLGIRYISRPANWKQMSAEEQQAYNLRAARAVAEEPKKEASIGGIFKAASVDRNSRLQRLTMFAEAI